jgi:hypothetical protein
VADKMVGTAPAATSVGWTLGDSVAWAAGLVVYDVAPGVPVTGAVYNAMRELDVGDRLQITTSTPPANTAQPVWLPRSSLTSYARGGIDVLVNQLATMLGTDVYDVGVLGIPTTPYIVATTDDPVHGRTDSGTSTLDAPMAPTDTLLAVANPVTTPQNLWTLNEAAYPFDLGVGGEQITAVSISGTPVSGSSDAANPPQIALAPSGVNSLLYAAITNPTSATTFTPDANTTFSANVADATNTKCYGTCRTTASPPQGPGTTTFGASAPAVSARLAAVEVMVCGGGTITEDASSPASVSTLAAKTVTTATFTPPAGSLLLLMVAANGTGGGFVGMSFSIPYSGGHWRQLALDGLGQCAIMAFRVPANATGPVSVTVTTSGTFSANGLLATLKVLNNGASGSATEVMAVVRSQNGVVKAQAAGTKVALYSTPTASL